MKKDTQNVLITFSLIGVTLLSGSLFHTTVVKAEQRTIELTVRREQEALQAELLLQEQLFQITAAPNSTVIEETPEIVAVPVKKEPAIPTKIPNTSTVSDTVTLQAQIDKQKAEADALAKKLVEEKKLAQQIADAKLAAEKLAKQQAADAVASKPSRNSSAS